MLSPPQHQSAFSKLWNTLLTSFVQHICYMGLVKAFVCRTNIFALALLLHSFLGYLLVPASFNIFNLSLVTPESGIRVAGVRGGSQHS